MNRSTRKLLIYSCLKVTTFLGFNIFGSEFLSFFTRLFDFCIKIKIIYFDTEQVPIYTIARLDKEMVSNFHHFFSLHIKSFGTNAALKGSRKYVEKQRKHMKRSLHVITLIV